MTDTSQSALELLDEIRRLMDLKGENPFKVRAFEKASDTLSERTDLLERAKNGTLTELPGIGKGIAEVLTEFLLHGTSTVRDELMAGLPAGLLELTTLPGLGPKKARQLIDELGVHSLGELEYACRENRLLKIKGFGDKAQKKILDAIQFQNATRGMRRIDEAFPFAERAHTLLLEVAGGARVSETGALRRRFEILSELEFAVDLPAEAEQAKKLALALEEARTRYARENPSSLPLRIHHAPAGTFGYELARSTATPFHWKALGAPAPFQAEDESDFFARLELPLIPPEMRETGEEIQLARQGRLEQVLPWNGIQGVFHNHTTRSDGVATLEEMVLEARRLGLKYIGISDHSQSAFYAQGLREADLQAQEREIRELQEKYDDIRIFWGIESDILADGSLDYEPRVLERFDFVVASIHSRFQMDRETMTQRVLEAIRNPFTRFLGHATGRLLLGRPGYELDMEKVIEEASQCDVAIEINANPARLDIDWRWGPSLRKHGTCVSVNPDAHSTSGLSDTIYGVAVARKALLPSSQVINSGDVKQVEQWLKRN